MNIDLSFIEQKLQEANYEPALGVRLVHLETTEVSGKILELIAIKLDPGKQLVPHLHEIDGEICTPLTEGVATLGDARKDKKGDYEMEGDLIVVDWEASQTLTPGKPFNVLPSKAHHLRALKDKPFVLFFILPQTHLGSDRKFVVYPQK